MKRFLSLFACFLTIFCIVATPTFAEETCDQILVSEKLSYLGNDCYCIEKIYVPCVDTQSSTCSGTKTAEYIQSGKIVFSLSVTGQFTYDGSTAEAISATGTVTKYVSNLTINSQHAFTSDASAIATASVTYSGTTLRKTVTLTCDRNGDLF